MVEGRCANMTWGGLADCGGICPGISKYRRSRSCGKERTAFQSVGLTEAGVPTQGSWGGSWNQGPVSGGERR